MKYGLDDKTIIKIQNIFARFPEVDKVIIYGSKVRGNYFQGSGMDFAMEGEHISELTLDKIFSKLVKLDLIYVFSLCDIKHITDNVLYEQIGWEGVEFYNKRKKYKLGTASDLKKRVIFYSDEGILDELTLNLKKLLN